MAIKIEFDGPCNPRVPTIVLASRSGKKIGVLNTVDNITIKDSLAEASEISFDVHKYVDRELFYLWDQVKDFMLIWCKEWQKWFSIQVKITESDDTVKNVIGTTLGSFELSHIMLYGVEINTEDDISRDDYDKDHPTILYDPEHPESSLLHRVLSKAPHYSIGHVDESIRNIQRIFSFDGKSIVDAFSEVGEEIGCMFSYSSEMNQNGTIDRTVSVYDTQQTCLSCDFRGDFIDKCPQCGSTNIHLGHGEDTTIFVSTDCLTEEITYETDIESIKTAYRISAGDDLLTAVSRECNITPGGYIYYFSPELRAGMSQGLSSKLDEYDEQYSYYSNSATIDHPESVADYNTLVTKYSTYNEDLKPLPSPLVGYSDLMKARYSAMDFANYLQTWLAPTPSIDHKSASDQAALLTQSSMSPIALSSLTNKTTTSNVEDAIRIMAGVLVDTSQFRLTVNTSSWNNPTWTGTITVTSYSDSSDTANTPTLTITINDDYVTYTKQVIDRKLSTLDDKNYGVVGLFKLSLVEFSNEIKKYSLDMLKSFDATCQDIINIIISSGGNKPSSDLYQTYYIPFTQKKQALESEIDVRHNEIVLLVGDVTTDGSGEETIVTKGLKQYIDDVREEVRSEMDYESFLGHDLWLEFCSYIREDDYSNSNYTSEGLTSQETVDRALEYLKRAKEELYKAASMQHTISATLNNLLVIKEFEPIIEYFSVGNWIRVRVDDVVYRLKLVDYEIDYSDLSTISVTFSDVTKRQSSLSTISDVLSKSIFSSNTMNEVSKLANKGDQAATILDSWLKDGLLAGDEIQLYNKDGSPIFNQAGQLIVSRGVDQSDLSDLMKDVAPDSGESALTVYVDSSAGNIFKNRGINTILTATVYYGTQDVTDDVTSFHWIKRDKDGNVDPDWSRVGAGRSIVLSSQDVNNKAVFVCEVDYTP